MSLAIDLVERGWVPDALTRHGIRRLLRDRLTLEATPAGRSSRERYIGQLATAPLAIEQAAANQQHYEVPPGLFELMLGPRLKYSSCWWESGIETLAQAEDAMLDLSCRRAGLCDGMDILEIGCGWGSLTLWMAEHYPASRIHAISNSAPQRRFIEARAQARGLTNVTVQTIDVTAFAPTARFDRVVSVECFEHLRNYAELFRRVRTWLKPEGRLWTHIFVHREYSYPFETEGDDNWMGRHFFTGGQMPGFDLFRRFDQDLVVTEAIPVNGKHYARTARAWLAKLDRNRDQALRVLAGGSEDPTILVNRWRMFWMACEELWAYRNGEEWLVGHYLLAPR